MPDAMPSTETPESELANVKSFDESVLDYMNGTMDEEEPQVEVEPPAEPTIEKKPPVAEAPAPETPPVAKEPPPEEVAPQAPKAVAPPAPQPQQPPPQPQVQQPQAPTEEQIRQYHAEVDRRLFEAYTPTKEQMTELEEAGLADAAPVLAKMAATLHKNVLAAVWGGVTQQLVPMIDTRLTTSSNEEKFWGAFYNKWPDLSPHRDYVQEFATSYLRLKPNASPEEFREEVGRGVSAMLGIQPPPQPVPAPPPVKEPTPPAGYQPAGTSTQTRQGSEPKTQMEVLFEEILSS